MIRILIKIKLITKIKIFNNNKRKIQKVIKKPANKNLNSKANIIQNYNNLPSAKLKTWSYPKILKKIKIYPK